MPQFLLSSLAICERTKVKKEKRCRWQKPFASAIAISKPSWSAYIPAPLSSYNRITVASIYVLVSTRLWMAGRELS